MKVQGNVGQTTVQEDIKLYTGVVPVQVVAICPSLAECHELGMTYVQEEPNYVTDKDDDGVPYTQIRIDFIVSHIETKTLSKVSFFVDNRQFISNDGTKMQYINDFGKVAWGTPDTPPDSAAWFDATKGARPAYRGEAELINFLVNWLNINLKSAIVVEDWPRIFKGDFSELRDLLKVYGDNKVKVMLIVFEKDGKFYQNVYSKYFARWNNSNLLAWKKFVDKPGTAGNKPPNQPKNAYWTYELKEFDINSVAVPDAEPTPEELVERSAKATKFF